MSKPFSLPHDLRVDYITEQLYFYSMISTIQWVRPVGFVVDDLQSLWLLCLSFQCDDLIMTLGRYYSKPKGEFLRSMGAAKTLQRFEPTRFPNPNKNTRFTTKCMDAIQCVIAHIPRSRFQRCKLKYSALYSEMKANCFFTGRSLGRIWKQNGWKMANFCRKSPGNTGHTTSSTLIVWRSMMPMNMMRVNTVWSSKERSHLQHYLWR